MFINKYFSMSINDDLGYHVFPELFSLGPSDMFPPCDEIVSFSPEVERLNIDVNTKFLRVEVERVRRQKLRSKLKRMKPDIIPYHRLIAQIRHDVSIPTFIWKRACAPRNGILPLQIQDSSNSNFRGLLCSHVCWESHGHIPVNVWVTENSSTASKPSQSSGSCGDVIIIHNYRILLGHIIQC